jgi:GNAT superfamily N-acetyltransferase
MAKKTDYIYKNLTEDDFSQVIELGNLVHGDGYLSPEEIKQWTTKGISQGINTGYVVYDGNKLIGFRITYAIEQWHVDQWCSPELWQVPIEKVCYFKCNTVDANYRGHGIGGNLLKLSIEAVKKQGALAGISHLWMPSPGNSAVKYFTKCGGKLIKVHADKWNEDSKNGYNCTLCGFDCHCEAAEMIIHF